VYPLTDPPKADWPGHYGASLDREQAARHEIGTHLSVLLNWRSIVTTFNTATGQVTATVTDDYAVPGHSGKPRTQRELTDAFNLVAPRPNWKEAIDCTIPRPFDADLISDAVVHFTGAVPTFGYAVAHVVHVRAPGYYATIGARHAPL